MSSSVHFTKKGETVKTGSDPGLNDSERGGGGGGEAGDIEAGQRIKGNGGKKSDLASSMSCSQKSTKRLKG